jgi:ribosomal-protein-alanine N-acetyltransferase
MSQADAEAIACWHYPDPFSFYDWTSDPNDLAGLLDPTARGDDYVAVEDEAGSLIGFFHFKRPHGPRLEIGLGLHPEWTGQGLGRRFLEAGLEYARRRFAPRQFTLSVASFNRRAITVYERAGCARPRLYALDQRRRVGVHRNAAVGVAKAASPSGTRSIRPCSRSAARTRRSQRSSSSPSARSIRIAHIMRKLQLETRAELVMFALANGVIGPNAD